MLLYKLSKPHMDPKTPIKSPNYGPFTRIFLQTKELGIWEYFFRVLITAFIAWGIYNLFSIYYIHTDPKYKEFEMYPISDMLLAIVSCAIFTV